MATNKVVKTWDDLPDIMTTKQAADFLQLSVNTVKRMCRMYEIEGKRIGAGWRIEKRELMRFMAGLEDNSGSVAIALPVSTATGQSETGNVDLVTDLHRAAELAAVHNRSDLATRLLIYANQLATSTAGGC